MVKSTQSSIVLLCLVAAVKGFSFAPARRCASAIERRARNHYFLSAPTAKFSRRLTLAAGATEDSNSSIDSTMASEPDLPYKFVTLVGKSASSLVSLSFFLLLATRRDALTLTLFIGSIYNAVSSKVLKKVLNHERPANLQLNENVKLKPSDGGMPSSHAMSLGFIGTVITCAIIPLEQQYLVGSAMSVYSLLALRYRVRDHLHTIDQVAVGLSLGVANALFWLKYALGNDKSGPVMAWVKNNCVSAETGVFPYVALAVPILVGVLVVGSFERRIALWLKEKKAKTQ